MPMVNDMHVTCEHCGTTLSVRASVELRFVRREPTATERGEYLIVESAGPGDVLLHSCPILAPALTSNG
jgi:uncharacterized protein (AIM24 family)